jgi:hypothetical protein
MKKVAILALMLAMGLSMQAGAASIGIPWFVDSASTGVRIPPTNGTTTTIIYLNNNSNSPVECAIAYFDQEGNALGPVTNNTFELPANATVAFRPVADDPATVPGGQESAVARTVPNRPQGATFANNGSARITYDDQGGTVRITGKSETWQHRIADPADASKGYATLNSAYLLPN